MKWALFNSRLGRGQQFPREASQILGWKMLDEAIVLLPWISTTEDSWVVMNLEITSSQGRNQVC